jgi:hypothetical protein
MIQRNSIMLQKEKNAQYQELLADQVEKNANLQIILDASKAHRMKLNQAIKTKALNQELEEAKKEIEEMREKTQKVLEYKDMLQQEVNQLKAEAEQQMIKQIKEYSSKEQQTTPNETVFSKSILERDADEKQIQKEMALQARIQILTEDKEAMGKDNDIIRHELKENNYWIDNQQGLMKALEEAGNV